MAAQYGNEILEDNLFLTLLLSSHLMYNVKNVAREPADNPSLRGLNPGPATLYSLSLSFSLRGRPHPLGLEYGIFVMVFFSS